MWRKSIIYGRYTNGKNYPFPTDREKKMKIFDKVEKLEKLEKRQLKYQEYQRFARQLILGEVGREGQGIWFFILINCTTTMFLFFNFFYNWFFNWFYGFIFLFSAGLFQTGFS